MTLFKVRIKLAVLTNCHLGDTHHERFGYGYLVGRLFVKVYLIFDLPEFPNSLLAKIILQRRTILAHDEGSGLDGNKFHPQGICYRFGTMSLAGF